MFIITLCLSDTPNIPQIDPLLYYYKKQRNILIQVFLVTGHFSLKFIQKEQISLSQGTIYQYEPHLVQTYETLITGSFSLMLTALLFP